jgi:DNA-binding response OmpR family regulator
MRVLLLHTAREPNGYYPKALQSIGYECHSCSDLTDAVVQLADHEFDIMVVHYTPRTDQDCRFIEILRGGAGSMPILVMSPSPSHTFKISVLNSGADDIVDTSIYFEELCARIHALLRRQDWSHSSLLSCHDLQLDLYKQQVTRGKRLIRLTRKEFALLEFMLRQRGRVLSRATIFEHVWASQGEYQSNVVDAYIRLLRRKIDATSDEPIIHTVIGMGYTIRTPAAS